MGIEIELPDGWKVTKLAEFVTSKKGKKPKYVSTEKSDEFNIPYVNIKAFEKNIIDEYTNGEGCVFCEDDDFLMVWDGSRSGYVGRAIKGAIGSTLVRLSFPQEVFEKYAYYYLQSKYIEINTRAKGVGIPHVDPNLVWNYQFLLPPIKEQHQIVEKLEELFSELDKGIENLKTAQQQLKVYRQAVLKWAFEGKLTNENVKEGELPEGWALVKTKDVIDTINNGYTPTREFLFEGHGEIPFIKVYNLNFNGTLNFDKNPTFIPKAIHLKDLKRSVCEPGDVLINIVGPPLGKVSVVPKLFPEWNINQAIVLFKPNDKVISKYISYFLQNPVTINWLEGTSKATAGQWNVKVSTCREIPFPFCPVEQQQRVVDEIEDRLSVCDKMEETISTSLQQAEALRQSILKRAFEGKLVKMEKIKQEAVIVSISHQRDDWQRKVLAGWIIFACHKDKYFGRTKFQKTLYLCEQFAQLDFDAHYLKMTAGPLDASFIYPFIKEAETNGWFVEETDTPPYYFEPLIGIGALTKYYPQYFKPVSDKINFIIKLLQGKNTDESELIATIYAIWNNYIIDCKVITSELLTAEVYDWADSKSKFRVPVILSTWQWMKDNGLVPVGFGKLITKSA